MFNITCDVLFSSTVIYIIGCGKLTPMFVCCECDDHMTCVLCWSRWKYIWFRHEV